MSFAHILAALRHLVPLALLMPAGSVWAQSTLAGQESVSRYELFSRGLPIGRVETVRSIVERDGRELIRCAVHTEVDAGLLWFKYRLDNREEVLLDQGHAVTYHQRGVEDGRTNEVVGEQRDDAFHFTLSNGNASRSFAVPREAYEATTMDGIELGLEKKGEAVHRRVLDLGLVQVVDRRYGWTATEQVEAGGTPQACRIIEYSDRNRQGKRWVFGDALGMVIVRQDAKDQAGSYSMRMVSQAMRPRQP